MKKIFIFILTIFIYNLTFSDTHQDYTIFINGKNSYYAGNFEQANKEFETLLRAFPYSHVFDENYAYFFIGMNYFRLKDYEKASLFLEKAVYAPKKTAFNTDADIEKAIFFSERDYALGYSLIKIGDIEKGITYLKRLDYSTYIPVVGDYEKKALELLAKYDPKAYDKIALKFNFDFSKIKNMTIPQLVKIGDFYTSQKNYKKAKEFYEYILKNVKLGTYGQLVNKNYLKILLNLKDYKHIIEYTNNPPQEYKDLFNFYRAMAYYQTKDFTRALYLFEGITNKEYISDAKYYSVGIYFALGDYKNTIENAKLIPDKSIISQSMLAFSYLYLNDTKHFEQTAKTIINKYSNTYIAAYFSLLLDKVPDIPTHINSIKDMSMLVDQMIKNAKPLPHDFMKKADLLEIDQLSQIAKYGDQELLQLSFDKGNFLNKSSLAYGYSTTIVLENGKFYSLALKNSLDYMRQFLNYKQLMPYEYPLYFENIVNSCSKKYDVPQEIIYSIIHNLSKFNIYFVSEDAKFGLMGIEYSGNENLDLFDIFTPEINIEIGTKMIKKLLDKYDGNELKALIAYINGESYLSSLYFEGNNDLNFTSIVIPEERYSLENLFLTYVFYSKLYRY